MAIRIVEMVLSTSRKINMGNYESKDLFMSAKVELTNGTSQELREAHKALTNELDELEAHRVAMTRAERDGDADKIEELKRVRE